MKSIEYSIDPKVEEVHEEENEYSKKERKYRTIN
jgi:hypothetical protein